MDPSSDDPFEEDNQAEFVDNDFRNYSVQKPLIDDENEDRLLFDSKALKIPQLKRILIVDDEPFNIMGMQITMNQLNIKGLIKSVDRAYNGLEAFNKVKDALLQG